MNPRRPQKPIIHPHGWVRADDRRAPSPSTSGTDLASEERPARAGTSFLLALTIAVIAGMGIARVHASTEILEIGAEISELTAEQSRLLEQQRRLAAERAYLRHPDRIEEFARDRLGMVPVAPELVQQIRVVGESSPP